MDSVRAALSVKTEALQSRSKSPFTENAYGLTGDDLGNQSKIGGVQQLESRCFQKFVKGHVGIEPKVSSQSDRTYQAIPDGRDTAEEANFETQNSAGTQQLGHGGKRTERIRKVGEQVAVIDNIKTVLGQRVSFNPVVDNGNVESFQILVIAAAWL